MIRYQPTSTAPRARHACRQALIARMADDMRELAFAGQNVSEETLAQRDWPAATIKRLSPEAIKLARRQSVRRLT